MCGHVSTKRPYRCEPKRCYNTEDCNQILSGLVNRDMYRKKDKARQQKPITLQQFVHCLYTVSSGTTLLCTNTNPSGCYTLRKICSNHISVLLLSVTLVRSVI